MKQKILIAILLIFRLKGLAQQDSASSKKERLDFAKTYFEAGGTFLPAFTGKTLGPQGLVSFKNPASAIQYLNWGAFHFWRYAELYVSIPLSYMPFRKNTDRSTNLLHSVTTGARVFPLRYQERKISPYIGLGWSALEFRQKIKPDQNAPTYSKDFMLSYDAGLLYGLHHFAFRLGLHYFPDSKWEYPLNKSIKESIKTPGLGLQIGLLYSFEASRSKNKKTNDEWNSFPRLSKQSMGSGKFGDFFLGIGPSISYSLLKSAYNQSTFPYLKNQLTSTNYFDIALGYHFQKMGLFTALSFRNPRFGTEGFGSRQSISKTSLALEVNKFLFDYSGFAPFIGINLAYDKINYTETVNEATKELVFDKKTEPGITFGWDIQPGKNQEALILRTNLRWYPFARFRIDEKPFNFSQLEYNLIQVILYPERLKKKTNR